MMKYFFSSFVLLVCSMCSAATFVVSTPHVHSGSMISDLKGIPVVNVSPNGFMAIWQQKDSNELVTSSSVDGMSWSSLSTLGLAMNGTLGWVSGNSNGYVGGGVNFDSSNINPFVSFYSQSSKNWTSPEKISGSINYTCSSGIYITSSNGIFVAGWANNPPDPDYLYNMYVNVSGDGTNWFSEPICVGTSTQVCCFPSFPSISMNNGKIMYAWLDPGSASICVSFSSDQGYTWSSPSLISSVPFSNNVPLDTSVGSHAMDRGYLLAYNGAFGEERAIYTLFSSDGIHWSHPSIVTDGLVEKTADLMPAVSGNDCGFVVAWVGADCNIHVSISEDGINWSSPIDVTHDGSVYSSYLQDVSLSMQNEKCIFGWRNKDGNAVTCTATLTN